MPDFQDERIAIRRKRRFFRAAGAATLEIIVALPLLLAVSLALFQFGVLEVVQQAVTEAAIEGARAAAREATGSDAREAATAAANEVLAVHGLAISPTSMTAASGAGVRLAIEFPNGATVDVVEAGDTGVACELPASPVLAPTDAETRVTVCMDLTKKPLLNLLSTFGIDAFGSRLQVSALVAKE